MIFLQIHKLKVVVSIIDFRHLAPDLFFELLQNVLMKNRPDTPIRDFSAEAVGERLRKFQSVIKGIHAPEDIEHIHQIRVTSRRLRAVLEVFKDSLPDGKSKVWRKKIRLITRALGPARDLDVQLDFLTQFIQEVKDPRYKEGLERVQLRLQQKRTANQNKVEAAVSEIGNSRIFEKMEKVLEKQKKPPQVSNSPMSTVILKNYANLEISRRLRKFLAFDSETGIPESTERMHQMRIEGKALRYTMEVFASNYDESMTVALKKMRKVQNFLGEVHDCDMWIESLPIMLERERRKTLDYFGHLDNFEKLQAGFDFLIENRKKERIRLYMEFINFWESTKKQNIWESLRKTLGYFTTQEEISTSS